jgi:hypothetical protein
MPDTAVITATDIDAWAARRTAQDYLPVLLRRLIHATADGIEHIGFPAHESVQFGGWDGVLMAAGGDSWIPLGASRWEMGTSDRVSRKAGADYTKRTGAVPASERAQSTFVFVTARRWSGKVRWVEDRRREDAWLDVRAYDADDLEQWLENAPAVHSWFADLIGRRPTDADDLGTYWADWAAATTPALTPGIVLARRDEVVTMILDWLRGTGAELLLIADSRQEALAVFAASVEGLQPEERVALQSQAVVVHADGSFRALIRHPRPLVLIPLFDPCEAAAATRRGHRVVIALDRREGAGAATALDVGRVSKQAVRGALEAIGIPERRLDDLSRTARRSMLALRRALAGNPRVQQPPWATPTEGPALLPLVFAGSWNLSLVGDREMVGRLAGCGYEEFQNRMVRWAADPDPPVRRVGDAWFAVSKADLWAQLQQYVTDEDLSRFAQVAKEVMTTPDPSIGAGWQERVSAQLRGERAPYSDLIRQGIAESLALIGTYGLGVPASKASRETLLACLTGALSAHSLNMGGAKSTVRTMLLQRSCGSVGPKRTVSIPEQCPKPRRSALCPQSDAPIRRQFVTF